MLSQKAERILIFLIQNESRPVTAGRIAKALDISERSVSTYLKEVYGYCRDQGILVENKAGTGITVRCDGRAEELLKLLPAGEKGYDSSEQRIRYIMRVLLNNWTNYTTALFAEDLGVSKNTVGRELKQAEFCLKQRGIEVVKKPGAGIFARGPELKMRQAIVAVNREWEDEDTIPPNTAGDYRLKEKTVKRLLGCYRGCPLKEYVRLIQNMEDKWNKKLSDRSFEALTEYLAVTNLRVRQGYTVDKGFWEDKKEICPGSGRAAELLAKPLGLPGPEWDYIELLLNCMEYQEGEETGNTYEELTEEVIRYVSGIVGLDFTGDSLLREAMNGYHQSAVPRIRYGIELENPFLEEVKKTYPAVFSACFAAGCVIYPRFTGEIPSENEISNLSLLVGGAIVRSDKKVSAVVVCAGGVGTSQILARKLSDQVPELLVTGILGYGQSVEMERLRPQLVVTTVRGISASCPVVSISPVVTGRDLKMVRRACSEIYTKAEKTGGGLSDLLEEDLIFLDYEEDSRERLLDFMAGELWRRGYVEAEFFKDVREREEKGSTALGFGVAIPHGVSGLVKVPVVSVVRLKENIDWSGEPVSLVFMLALNFTDIEHTRAFFNGFYNLTSEPGKVELLKRAESPQAFRRMIAEHCI